MEKFIKLLFASSITGLIAACAAIPDPAGVKQESSHTPSELDQDTIDQQIDYGSFTKEQLFEAIISELGAQRGDLKTASDNYFDLAMETKDLAIIQRAIQFASVNGDSNAIMQLALLWSAEEPLNAQPHLMLSFQFLETGNYEQALSHMARVLDMGGEMDFTTLTARTGSLETKERESLIAGIKQLSREFEGEESIHIALIQLLAQNLQLQEALTKIQVLSKARELSPNMIILHGQVLQSLGNSRNAIRVLRNGVRRFGQDKSIRIGFARLLIQNGEISEAREQFEKIIDQDPKDWESLYSASLLEMELKNFDRAIILLEKLIDANQRYDESRYYLGFIYEAQENFKESISQYRQVRVGTNNYLAAQQRATFLSISLGELDDAHSWLVRQSGGQSRLEILFTTIESSLLIQAGYVKEAKDLLDKALNRFPNEVELLFARVLWFDSQGDSQGSEQDLRQIILMQPEDSRALNHLGYMLADQTTRFEEALELIERAILISPDDPAIIDSLAWTQYKLGLYDEAMVNLRRAYNLFPDHEVASHLGEVLWMLGRYDEANEIWKSALEITPESEIIKEAIERLRSNE